MTKDEIINFLYYLEDKVDPVFAKEVRRSIERFLERWK